jgi:hypothetical protein
MSLYCEDVKGYELETPVLCFDIVVALWSNGVIENYVSMYIFNIRTSLLILV